MYVTVQAGGWAYNFVPKNIRKIRFEIQKIEVSNLNEFISDMIDKEIRGENYRRQKSDLAD